MQIQYLSGQETTRTSTPDTHAQKEEGRPRRPKVQAGQARTWEGAESVPTFQAPLPGDSSHVEVPLSFLNKLPLRRSPGTLALLLTGALGLCSLGVRTRPFFPFSLQALT